jgi:ABC-type transporter Mla subunit MlaD
MKSRTNYFLLGLFVLAGIAATFAGVLFFGATTFASRGLIVESYFAESVQGLEKGAIVRFRGVRIGVVTDILLASQAYPTDRPYALVRSLLDPTDVGLDEAAQRAKLRARVAQGYRVRLSSQGLTGALYLETDLIAANDAEAEPLEIDWTPAYERVPSVPSVISRIGQSFEEVLGSLQRTDFPGLVDDARQALQSVTGAVKALDPGGLRQSFESLTASTTEALDEVRGQFQEIATSTSSLLDEARVRVAAIDPEALSILCEALGAVAQDLPATRARLDAFVDTATLAAGDLRGEVRAKGQDLDLILAELRRASAHLAGLSETLERYPSLLLLGAPPQRTELGR